jgi:hypothetical protein
MKTSWLANLTEQQKEEVRLNFLHSGVVRERLTAILNAKIETNERELVTKEMYDSPSWALRQADGVGYKRAMNEVISLLT